MIVVSAMSFLSLSSVNFFKKTDDCSVCYVFPQCKFLQEDNMIIVSAMSFLSVNFFKKTDDCSVCYVFPQCKFLQED